jgi:hypothetical protein
VSYFRRGLSGVQSQPQGGRISRGALAGVQSQPSGGRIARGALGMTVIDTSGVVKAIATQPTRPPPPPSRIMTSRGKVGPRWYRQTFGSLGSLGADENEPVNTLAAPTLGEPQATSQFRENLLDSNRQILAAEKERIRKEELRGYLQIGATLMIPVAAAIWKRLGIGKRKKSEP